MRCDFAVHEQSPDINQGVDRSTKRRARRGDRDDVWVCNRETENFMPLALDISHRLMYD